MNRKNLQESSFDWKTNLSKPGFRAASVSLFKHAPGAAMWTDTVAIGIKLMVRHNDIPVLKNLKQRRPRVGFWPVTVVKIQGYYVQARYEGMRDSSHDFWIHIGSNTVFPVGAEGFHTVLIPPECVYRKSNVSIPDLRTYLVKSLSGKTTLPLDFHSQLRCLINSRKYRTGDLLEVIDKDKISQFRIGRITKMIGCRMNIKYVDSCSSSNQDGTPTTAIRNFICFHCHEQSSLIHCLGWADCIGHEIQLPKNYKPSLNDKKDAVVNKAPLEKPFDSESELFQEGMKLEAVDPLCPSRIGAATICKILGYGHIMLKIDYYDDSQNEEGEKNEWFCYAITSPYIFNCGFCKKHGIKLTPPAGYTTANFAWNEYLEKNGFLMAPVPDKAVIDHQFKVSMKLEMADVMVPSNIYVGTIKQVVGRLLRISFDGWEKDFDQWIDAESPDIYPIGWCALVGHKKCSKESSTRKRSRNALSC